MKPFQMVRIPFVIEYISLMQKAPFPQPLVGWKSIAANQRTRCNAILREIGQIISVNA